MKKIRVMVVDDSALMRKLISEILSKDPEIEVVNTAMDGVFALKKIPQSRPDVITLDLDMPRMDGLTALRYIVNDYQIPVVLVSSLATDGGSLIFEGLALGAVDFVTKPKDAISVHIHEVARELVLKVKIASRTAVKKTSRPEAVTPLQQRIYQHNKSSLRGPLKKIVAIGSSTGGPNAISYFLPRLPEDIAAAILIVQHMPEGFTEMFASRLDQVCKIRVKEAKEGDPLVSGTAFIAPGNKHLKVAKVGMTGVVVLSASPPVHGHRPSVDVLFDSVSQEYGSDTIGLLMTGMGEDGAHGLGSIKASGGYTMAQDEASCVVFGMPRAALYRGHAHEVVSLDAIPDRLTTLLKEVNLYADRPGQTL
jgi:two-component system, chemotaxis family, protein-glutamate methylesterase/glutaminase